MLPPLSSLYGRDDGFNAKKVRAAGFSAAEALDAPWTVEVLRAAGYAADELRKARRSARELKAAGFTLTDLRQAGYPTQELQVLQVHALTRWTEGTPHDLHPPQPVS